MRKIAITIGLLNALFILLLGLSLAVEWAKANLPLACWAIAFVVLVGIGGVAIYRSLPDKETD